MVRNHWIDTESDDEEGNVGRRLTDMGVYRTVPLIVLPFEELPDMPEWNFAVPELDLAEDLEYLAEGNAHVIFAIHLDLEDQPRRVLRLQKDTRRVVDPLKNMTYFSHQVRGMFADDQVIDQGLLPTDADTMEALNDMLIAVEREGRRSAKRQGTFLKKDQEWIVVMTDMRPQTATQSMIEFKPKWLVQSPSAPANSNRCRTCALREMRESDGRAKGEAEMTTHKSKPFCPLDLLSDDIVTLRAIAKAVDAPDDKLELFAKGLLENDTIARLRKAQYKFNGATLKKIGEYEDIYKLLGVQRPESYTAPDDVPMAMTIRDCTLFMRVDESNSPPTWECVLADLDMKKPSQENLDRWADTEKRLIDEGWYQGVESENMSNKKACNLQLARTKPQWEEPEEEQ